MRNLRWALIHLDQLTPAQMERMKKLGVSAGVQPRSTIMGGIFHRVHSKALADATPPFRTIQESGMMWGLGTDAFEVNQYRPFTTLSFAVTGKMVGGDVVNTQTISREDALIAHTRSNSYFVFQENNLGSIASGKLADLVVLDRDYLTIPADQIKDIQPVMTMVGGKIVWDSPHRRADVQSSSRRLARAEGEPLPPVRPVDRLPHQRADARVERLVVARLGDAVRLRLARHRLGDRERHRAQLGHRRQQPSVSCRAAPATARRAPSPAAMNIASVTRRASRREHAEPDARKDVGVVGLVDRDAARSAS